MRNQEVWALFLYSLVVQFLETHLNKIITWGEGNILLEKKLTKFFFQVYVPPSPGVRVYSTSNTRFRVSALLHIQGH